MNGKVKKIGIPIHGKTHERNITLSIKLMRLEPKDSLKRIFLFKYQATNLQKGAQAPFSFIRQSFLLLNFINS